MRKKWKFLLCFLLIVSMLGTPLETQANTAQLYNNSYYTVHFDSTGGSTVYDQTVPYNGRLSYIPTPVRYGYRFIGWYTGQNGTGSYLTEWTQFTQNTTYYAYWVYEYGNVNRTLSYLNAYYNATSKRAGQTLTNSDFSVQAVYTDGYMETITSFSLSNTSLQQGYNSIVISYGTKSVIMVIYASSTDSCVTSTSNGTGNGSTTRTLSYLNAYYNATNKRMGQTLSNSDFTVEAVYSDGTVNTVTGFTLSSYYLQQNYNSITISYGGKSIVMVIYATTYDSYVTSTSNGTGSSSTTRTVSYLNASYNGTARYAGQTITNNDLTVQAVYTDGTMNTITGYTVSNRYLQYGNNSVVISYGGKSLTMVIYASGTNSYLVSTTGGQTTSSNTTTSSSTTNKETVTVHVSSSVCGNNEFQIEKGKPIQISKPSKKGYEFSGWYTNENCTDKYSMGAAAAKETYIFAKLTKYSNMTLSKKNIVLKKGKSTTVKVKGLTNARNAKWKSSNKKVATVDSKGTITAEGKGSATITVVLRDGTTRKCYVVVN